ncbi:hypothetical protein J3Q64DRAFT_1825937 [Phycomyces blakesleeanus]|uniref:Uncharacterized protein n=1 Tax=Phycomyces blakesleeanus TaxID=4837 RepID=A0ABR3AKB8_PHYBL
MATSHSQLLVPKDPPSYDSIYLSIPQSSSSISSSTDSTPSCTHAIRRFLHRQSAFFQRLAAATFVAATISTTVMLLLWQLQNLTYPQDPDGPWLRPITEVSEE